MEQFPYELGFDHRPVTIPDLYGHQRKRSAVNLVADHAGAGERRVYLGFSANSRALGTAPESEHGVNPGIV